VHCYLVEGIIAIAFISSPGLLREKHQIWVSQIGRWQHVVPFSLLGASFLKQTTLDGGGSKVEWCVSSPY
jgi:hypothetical protein